MKIIIAIICLMISGCTTTLKKRVDFIEQRFETHSEVSSANGEEIKKILKEIFTYLDKLSDITISLVKASNALDERVSGLEKNKNKATNEKTPKRILSK